jgi:hypothetical protein
MADLDFNHFSFPFKIRVLNKFFKWYINTYWTVIDLLSRKFPIISRIFYQRTINDEYNKEHKAIDLTKDDTILHIGCGVFPYSAILLSEEPHRQIVAIDTTPTITHHARQIIHDYNLDGRIIIDTGNAASYDLKPFTVIVLSSCVDLTGDILEHIISETSSNTRIIIRELRPMSRYILKFLKKQSNITLLYHYRIFSFPFYSVLGWDSFIVRKN